MRSNFSSVISYFSFFYVNVQYNYDTKANPVNYTNQERELKMLAQIERAEGRFYCCYSAELLVQVLYYQARRSL